MDINQKVDALKEVYDKATDKDNAEKSLYMEKIEDEMHGRIMNQYKSYDLMDNEKYQRIEYLLSVMQETFGFDLDAAGIAMEPADNEIGAKKSDSEATDREDQRERCHGETIEMASNPNRK